MTPRMRILTVVGNRPQFIKTAALSPLLRTRFSETLIHTGQHYDGAMSDLFFRELAIPDPDVNLAVGSVPPARRAEAMTRALGAQMRRHAPDCVIVYGDTDSTLAGVLAAVRHGIAVVHVEAGARSYNRSMPEEVNRLVADHSAELLLCPSRRCRDNLAREGIVRGVSVVGDLMRDLLDTALPLIEDRWRRVRKGFPAGGGYSLLTVHRPFNTDDPRRLDAILTALERSAEHIIWPVHPRCNFSCTGKHLSASKFIHPIPPQGYLDFITLLKHACRVVTDSGGVQKEAYWLGVPCLTLREETEWVETVEAGWNLLVGADPARILRGMATFRPGGPRPGFYGDGQAAGRILEVLCGWARRRAAGS